MFGAIAGGIASALAGGAMSKLFGGGQKAASGGIQGDVLATDNNTVGMGDAGIKSAIQGSNVPNPDEAVPSFVSGAIDRKSGSAGMPRPISYAVFCLKKKKRRSRARPADRPGCHSSGATPRSCVEASGPDRGTCAACASRSLRVLRTPRAVVQISLVRFRLTLYREACCFLQ